MTERVEQRICIRFCTKLKHNSSVETIQMIQKAAAIGNWWLAPWLWRCAHSCIMSCAKFFGKISNHSGDSSPLQPIFGTLQLLAFPKTKITFEKKDFRVSMRFRKIWQGSWWQLGELYEVPRCLLWRGLRCHCLMCNVFCIFLKKCLNFSCYMAGYFLDRPPYTIIWGDRRIGLVEQSAEHRGRRYLGYL